MEVHIIFFFFFKYTEAKKFETRNFKGQLIFSNLY